MAKFQLSKMVQRARHAAQVRAWRDAARGAGDTNIGKLSMQAGQARELRATLDDLLHVADNRLALPRLGSNAIHSPVGSDWSWRPDAFRGALPVPGMSSVQTRTQLGWGVTLFHDCPASELTLRQVRNTREEDLAPYGIRMDVFRFQGSFLSLAFDLPPAAVEGVKHKHLMRIDMVIDRENPIGIFARLNLQHGPNCEQLVRELDSSGAPMVEFDLAYMDFNEKRAEKIWVDLIFENPSMNQVTLRDMTFSRSPRADI